MGSVWIDRRVVRGAPETVFWRELMAGLGLVDRAVDGCPVIAVTGLRPGPVEGPAVVGGLPLRGERELPV